jgi:hypothetical protein
MSSPSLTINFAAPRAAGDPTLQPQAATAFAAQASRGYGQQAKFEEKSNG